MTSSPPAVLLFLHCYLASVYVNSVPKLSEARTVWRLNTAT